MFLKHPDLKHYKSYEDYKLALIQWEAMPTTYNKLLAEQHRDNVIKKRSKKMTEQNFAKGVNVKVVNTQYGEIIKLGINYEKVGENPINDDGWINLDILTSKNGKKYAVVDDYKLKKGKSDGQIMQFEDDGEIPY